MHVPHARHPERRREAACARVRRGELSRARQVLTAAELAPGDEATRAALTDPAKRPPQPREPIPPEVLQFQPPTPVRLTSTAVARSLREAKRGSAPGLSGARAEHYKVLLGHADDVELLTEAADLLAQAEVPYEVAAGVALTRMTAICKPGGRVCGIATGGMFRRLVSRALAAAWAPVFAQATRPYQFALRTRAGVDALSPRLRATLENDARATVVSLNGRFL